MELKTKSATFVCSWCGVRVN